MNVSTEGHERLASSLMGEMRRAMLFGSFLDNISRPTPAMKAVEAVAPKPRLSKKDKVRLAIAKRDGDDCWLCGKALGDDATIEHHDPRTRGGTGHIANLRLCHELCNRALAHRTPDEKIALRQATLAAGLGVPGEIGKQLSTGSGACLTSGPVAGDQAR
jgi:hypothetical protein